MALKDTVANAEKAGASSKNRVEILLEALPEDKRAELIEVLEDLKWRHASVTKAIPLEYDDYPEAFELKTTSVREWRVKRGLV